MYLGQLESLHLQIRAKIADLEAEIASEHRKLRQLEASTNVNDSEAGKPGSVSQIPMMTSNMLNQHIQNHPGPTASDRLDMRGMYQTGGGVNQAGGGTYQTGGMPHQSVIVPGGVQAIGPNVLLQRLPPPPPHRGGPSVDLTLAANPPHPADSGGQAPPPRRGGLSLTFPRRETKVLAVARPTSSPTASDDTVSYLSASSQMSARDDAGSETTSHLSATSSLRHQRHDLASAGLAGGTSRPKEHQFVIDLSDE